MGMRIVFPVAAARYASGSTQAMRSETRLGSEQLRDDDNADLSLDLPKIWLIISL
jgi:hypothetical protein